MAEAAVSVGTAPLAIAERLHLTDEVVRRLPRRSQPPREFRGSDAVGERVSMEPCGSRLDDAQAGLLRQLSTLRILACILASMMEASTFS